MRLHSPVLYARDLDQLWRIAANSNCTVPELLASWGNGQLRILCYDIAVGVQDARTAPALPGVPDQTTGPWLARTDVQPTGVFPCLSGKPADAARITWSFDRMVITVSKDRIPEQRAVVEQFGFGASYQSPPGTDTSGKGFLPPQYSCINATTGNPVGDPYAQIDTGTEIERCGGFHGDGCHYNSDGY